MEDWLDEACSKAKTQWLRELLGEKLPEIQHLTDSPEDLERARVWDAQIKQAIAERGLTRPEQQKNPITQVKNAIKSIDPKHPALEVVGLSTEQWIEINRQGEKRVGERSTQLLDCPQAIADRALKLLDSEDWSEVAAGLAVLTGRRSSELLQTACFEFKTPYSVTFTGQLKRPEQEEKLSFEIPTLAPAQRVIEALSKLRSLVPTQGLSNRELNKKYSGEVARACDSHFQDLVPARDSKDNLYTHLFRSVYATIASHWFCPPSVPEIEFRAAIQGHYQILKAGDSELRRTLAAERHYFDYRIGDGQGNIDGRLGIKLGQPGVEVLEIFRPQVEQAQERPYREKLAEILTPSCDRGELALGAIAVTGLPLSTLLESTVIESSQGEFFIAYCHAQDSPQLHPTLVRAKLVVGALAQLRQSPDVQLAEPTLLGFGSITEIQEKYQQLADKMAFPKPPKSNLGASAIAKERLLTTWKERLGTQSQRETVAALLDFAELAWQQGKLQPSSEPESGQPDLDQKLEQLVAAKVEDKLAQLSAQVEGKIEQLAGIIDEALDRAAKKIPYPPEQLNRKPLANGSNDSYPPDPILQKINAAIDGIIAYNNHPERTQEQKWAITIKLLKDAGISKSQGKLYQILTQRKAEIEQHHEAYGINTLSQNRGKDPSLLPDLLLEISKEQSKK